MTQVYKTSDGSNQISHDEHVNKTATSNLTGPRHYMLRYWEAHPAENWRQMTSDDDTFIQYNKWLRPLIGLSVGLDRDTDTTILYNATAE